MRPAKIGNAAAAQSAAARLARAGVGVLRRPALHRRGYRWGRRAAPVGDGARHWRDDMSGRGRLAAFAEAHTSGRGLWKWTHYFDIYERHLAKFVGHDARVVEIGVYSGGSIDMWREYFGPGCRIHGVDIAEACRAYADERVSITIGDQADPRFWAGFLPGEVIDVVIDDGGHEVDQQIETLEALLPRMSRGGVYICEDIAGVHNPFHAYLAGLTRNLDAWQAPDRLASRTIPTDFQRMVASVHRYPYLVVLELSAHPPEEFSCPRYGTEWQPF